MYFTSVQAKNQKEMSERRGTGGIRRRSESDQYNKTVDTDKEKAHIILFTSGKSYT